MNPISHGTVSGYQLHHRRGETPCDACLAARNAYDRDRYAANPEMRKDDNVRGAARQRALWRLKAEYPERFRQLFIEEVNR